MKPEDISKRALDPERGRVVAEALLALGVKEELTKGGPSGIHHGAGVCDAQMLLS